MVSGSEVDAVLNLADIPIIPKAREMAAMNVVPGGSLNNLNYVNPHVSFEAQISDVDRILLADAQTSGGLLISLPEGDAGRIVDQLLNKNIRAARIGSIIESNSERGTGKILVKQK